MLQSEFQNEKFHASEVLQALADRGPRIGEPFLQAFRLQHGPPGLLGRFFISADTRLKERGLTLRFVTFETLVDLHERNAEKWGFFNPMFDPRCSVIPPGAMCLAGFDTAGEIRVCICGKPFDARRRSFSEIVDCGGLFALKPGPHTPNLGTRIDAPVARELRGLVAYCASIWVHPDRRGDRLASIFVNLMNACMLTLWNPDYVIGFVPVATRGTGLHQRYNFPHASPALHVTRDGKPAFDQILIWQDASEALDGVARYLDVIWPQIDAAVISGNRQQHA